jgi:hypothetical protein
MQKLNQMMSDAIDELNENSPAYSELDLVDAQNSAKQIVQKIQRIMINREYIKA